MEDCSCLLHTLYFKLQVSMTELKHKLHSDYYNEESSNSSSSSNSNSSSISSNKNINNNNNKKNNNDDNNNNDSNDENNNNDINDDNNNNNNSNKINDADYSFTSYNLKSTSRISLNQASPTTINSNFY